MVLLTATGPEVYVTTRTAVLSNYYASLEDTLNHLKCLKLKDLLRDNVEECYAEILVDAKQLESAISIKPEHIGYTTNIFKSTSDPRFHIRETHKYKEVKYFIKKLHICDKDVMQSEELITYGYLVQEAMEE